MQQIAADSRPTTPTHILAEGFLVSIVVLLVFPLNFSATVPGGICLQGLSS